MAKTKGSEATRTNHSHAPNAAGLLTLPSAARSLGLSDATLRAWVWQRRIEFVRVGRSIRFKPETVDRLIEENTVPALAHY